MLLLAVFAEALPSMPVPLPPAFASESSRGEDAAPLPAVTGRYVHGFAGPPPVEELAGEPCQGSAADQQALLARLPSDGRTEFWLYATEAQGLMLGRTATVDPAQPCASALGWRHEVQRAYVADGIVHVLDAGPGEDLEALGSRPRTDGDGVYAGGSATLHNLMVRHRPTGRVHDRDIIAGLRADCRSDPGLVWSSSCVAAAGPARGLLLRAQAGDDERMMFSLTIDALRTGVTLPGDLFDSERRWRAGPE